MSLVGKTVGRIRIVEVLGRGGMGEVYAGWDEVLKRKVALKAIRREQRFHAEARARFLREAQILSQLDHPGICRIYELIEEEENDFLVLELIAGQSLRKALEEGLELPYKLYIVEKIAEALAAAHAKGVAHRDLKPENVMLTDEGMVKVLDFGLAHGVDGQLAAAMRLEATDEPPVDESAPQDGALPGLSAGLSDTVASPWSPLEDVDDEDDLTATVIATSAPSDPAGAGSGDPAPLFETQDGMVMGTIGYMSPEQARGERATVAGDMYSLGLMMQEMCTGASAYPARLKPLQLLAKVAHGETLPIGEIDPDLASLTNRLKSLAPEARPSAVETGERLWWILGKKRRLWRRLGAALVVVVLILGVIKYTTDLQHERRLAIAAQLEAEELRLEAEKVSEFLLTVFAVADPQLAQGNDITALSLLNAGAERVRELRDQPSTQARMMLTMGRAYRQLGFYDPAQSLLEEALVIRRGENLEKDDLETVRYIDQLSSLYHDQGRYEAAAPLFERALELREKLLGPEHPHVAASLNNLAFLYRAQGRNDLAEPLLLRALEIQRQALGNDHPDVARSLNNLGNLYRERGDLKGAELFLLRSIEMQEEHFGPEHPGLIAGLNNLAAVYHQQDETGRAEALYQRTLKIAEKVLGPEHPNVATALNNLAELYRATGRYAEADPLYRRALEIQEGILGASHPDVAVTLANLADLHQAQGEFWLAEPLYQSALTIQEKALGNDHPSVAVTLNHQADLMVAIGEDVSTEPLAEELYLRALEIQLHTFGDLHLGVLATLTDLADLYTAQARYEEAEVLYQRAMDLAARLLDERPDSRAARRRQAAVLLGWGRLNQLRGEAKRATELWHQALAIIEPLSANSDIVAGLSAHTLALLYLGRIEEAQPLARRLSRLAWSQPEFVRLSREYGLVKSPAR